jgi:DNA-binding response OmpR family regulator
MRVLVIDDSKDVTEVVRYYCESKQIECLTANSAVEGLAFINNTKFDLVLLDMAMPEVTGLDVIKHLKMKKLLKTMPIVIFTASSDPKLLSEVARLGVTERLKKPCGVAELDRVISKYCK